MIFKEFLNLSNINLFSAQNGKEAFLILKTKNVDIIFSDLNMPVMNGFQFVKKIRKYKKYKSTPLLALSGGNEDINFENYFEFGFDDFFMKPFTKEELYIKIAKFITI